MILHALKESEKQEKGKNNQQQQIKSKNKERIEVIREEFKELAYKLSKSIQKSDKGYILEADVKNPENILMN